MADSTQGFLFPGPHIPISAEPFDGSQGSKTTLAFGLVGAVLATLFICVHWSIALLAAMAVLSLSAFESEWFLLVVLFLTPVGWMLAADTPGRNVSVNLHFLVILGFFAGRVYRRNARLKDIFRPSVSQASLLFLCAGIAPIALGKVQFTYELSRNLYQLGTYVGFYFVVLAWVDSQTRFRMVLWVLLLSTLVTAMFALYQQIIGGYTSLWSYLNPQDDNSPPWSGRSTSFLGHPNSLACYLNLVLPFALACYLLGEGKWRKAGGCTLALGFLALVSTQSVGGLLAFVAILVLAIFCFSGNRKKGLGCLIALCVLLCLLYSLRPVLNPSHSEEVVGSDVVTRLSLWQIAWDEFIHSPAFGVGWGNFAAPYDWDIPFTPGVSEAHNIYLHLLAEMGLIGFSAFVNLVIQSWRKARCQLRASFDYVGLSLAFGVLGALLSVLVHGFVDVPFFAQGQTLLWVLLALLVVNDEMEHNSNKGGLTLSRARA